MGYHVGLTAQFLLPFHRLGDGHSKVSEALELRFEPREELKSLFQCRLHTCMHKTTETGQGTNLGIFFHVHVFTHVFMCAGTYMHGDRKIISGVKPQEPYPLFHEIVGEVSLHDPEFAN